MIKYGLKLWSDNTELFAAAAALFKEKKFDFIELHYNDAAPLDFTALKILTGVPVNLHSTDNLGFEKFSLGEKERAVWKQMLDLVTLFKSEFIIIHPGREHDFASFKANLAQIDRPEVLVENMSGLDVLGQPMYAARLDELEEIRQIKEICYDFEKAVKAAVYQGLDYKQSIADSLLKLRPKYFHLSGGDSASPVDQHLDLWAGNIDCPWVKQQLAESAAAQTIYLVFEVPKKDGLANDLKNMEYFRNL